MPLPDGAKKCIRLDTIAERDGQTDGIGKTISRSTYATHADARRRRKQHSAALLTGCCHCVVRWCVCLFGV